MSDVYFYAEKSFGDVDAVRADELGCFLLRPMESVVTPYVFVRGASEGYSVGIAESSARNRNAFSSASLEECIGYAKHLSETIPQPA